MSLFENESIKRILIRFKKLFLVLLLLPVLFAGIGYFIGMNQETTSTAKAEIMLGDFIDYSPYTDGVAVQMLLKNENFLKQLKEDYKLSYDVTEVANKTNPITKPGKVIELSYSSESKDKAEKVLQELVDAFLTESNKETKDNGYISFKEKKDRIEGSIEEYTVDKEKTLNEYKTELDRLRKTQINTDVSVDETSNNPLRKAILGFLVGLMFSISLLLFPEVIRK